MKGCGKSAPRIWQQVWHGKPHPEQDQIGAAHGIFGLLPGLVARAVQQCIAQMNDWLFLNEDGQNPAYRPSGILIFIFTPHHKQSD